MDAHPHDITGDRDPVGQVGDQDLGFVRSEERLSVQLSRTAVETVRVSRRIVTETVQVPVTIRREELSVTRTPVSGSPQAQGDPLQVEDLVLVLHEEVPVVNLEIRATERVTVGVDVVDTDELVTADLKREQVEIDTSGLRPGSS